MDDCLLLSLLTSRGPRELVLASWSPLVAMGLNSLKSEPCAVAFSSCSDPGGFAAGQAAPLKSSVLTVGSVTVAVEWAAAAAAFCAAAAASARGGLAPINADMFAIWFRRAAFSASACARRTASASACRRAVSAAWRASVAVAFSAPMASSAACCCCCNCRFWSRDAAWKRWRSRLRSDWAFSASACCIRLPCSASAAAFMASSAAFLSCAADVSTC